MNIYDYSCYGKLLVFRFAISIWAKKSPRRHCERLFGKSNHHFATASCDVDSYGGISHFKTTWLVVDLPLWKVWVRELGWWNSQLNGKNKTNVPTHQFQDPFQASRSDWSDPVPCKCNFRRRGRSWVSSPQSLTPERPEFSNWIPFRWWLWLHGFYPLVCLNHGIDQQTWWFNIFNGGWIWLCNMFWTFVILSGSLWSICRLFTHWEIIIFPGYVSQFTEA